MAYEIKDRCAKCRQQLELNLIEPHPTRDDLELHSYRCANCGPQMTKIKPVHTEAA